MALAQFVSIVALALTATSNSRRFCCCSEVTTLKISLRREKLLPSIDGVSMINAKAQPPAAASHLHVICLFIYVEMIMLCTAR